MSHARVENMTAKKTFIFLLRLFFVLFSLQFLKDAFYKWDGYSYYMRFTDFLPELSLAFILWSVIPLISAFALWLIAYSFLKIIPLSLIKLRLEYIIIYLILIIFLALVKISFFGHISLSGLLGINRFAVLVIGGVSIGAVVWFIRKYADKIIDEINTRITPLVWIFAVLFMIAVPLSFLKQAVAGSEPHKSSVSEKTISFNVKRPNIIFVVMDALSVNDMQLYGYERPTTPFITEFAKNAVVFKRAYSSSNWTSSSVMSLMTGQRPWTHKVWHFIALNQTVKEYEDNLPAILRRSGYETYAFVQNVHAHPKTLGISNGFSVKDKAHTFRTSTGWWNKLSDLFINRPIANEWIFNESIVAQAVNYNSDMQVTQVPPDAVYDRFLKYISETSQTLNDNDIPKPFFAYIHVYPPHNPYLPPKPFMGVLGDINKFDSDKKQRESGILYKHYSPERQAEVDVLRKRYDEFILYSDKQFELFLSQLYGMVDMSNTIIILSADHGESFSHGFQGHTGEYLYEPIVHVPLVIRMPDNKKNKAVNELVEQINLTPTILEFAGIPVPEWMEGQSLLPLIEGLPWQPQNVFSMQFMKNKAFEAISKGSIAVWDGDYKLIYYMEDNKVQLFNLKSDPDESVDVSDNKPEVTQRLKKLIQDNLANANERITQVKESL